MMGVFTTGRVPCCLAVILLAGAGPAWSQSGSDSTRAVPRAPYRPDPGAFVNSGSIRGGQAESAEAPLPEVIHGPLPTPQETTERSATGPLPPEGNPWARTAQLPERPEVSGKPPRSSAASPVGSPEGDSPTAEADPAELEVLKQQIERDTSLDEAMRKSAVSLLDQAAKAMRQTVTYRELAKKLDAEIVDVPNRLEDLQSAIAEPDFDPQEPLDALSATAASVQQLLVDAKTQLEESKRQFDAVKKRLDASRKKEIEARRAEIAAQLEELDKASADRGYGEGGIGAARRRADEALRGSLQADQELCPIKIRHVDAMERVWRLERDLAERDVRYWTTRSEYLSNQFQQIREQETQQEVAQSRQQAAEIHPSFGEWADNNAVLATRRTELATLLAGVETRQARFSEVAERIDTSFSKIQRKIEVAGHTSTVGLLLRRLRGNLPSRRELRHEIALLEVEMPRIELEKIEMDESRSQLGNIPELVERVIGQVDEHVLLRLKIDARAVAHQLVQQNRNFLDDLINDQNAYIERLSGLEDVLRALLARRDEVASYIDEHVLWIRSAEPLTPAQFDGSAELLSVLFDPQQKKSLTNDLSQIVDRRPYSSLVALLLVAAIIGYRGPIRERLVAACGAEDHRLKHTFAAVGWAALYASKWAPATIWLGWSLSGNAQGGDLPQAVGRGLVMAGSFLWVICWLRTIFMPGGLAERHFGWSEEITRLFRRWTMEMNVVGGSLAFLGGTLSRIQDGAWSDSWGRMVFVVAMLWVAWLVLRKIRRIDDIVQLDTGSWLARTRVCWQLLLVGTPLLLAALAIAGYYYSATQLASRMLWTGCLAIALMIGHGIGFRLANVLQQQLQDETSTLGPLFRKRGRKPAAEQEADHEIDVAGMHAQVHHLLRAVVVMFLLGGGFLVWAPVLPALQVLDRIELWSTNPGTAVVQASAASANDTTASPAAAVTALSGQAVSLADLLLAIGLTVVTVMLGRSLPSLLEVTLLKRLPIDRGGQHALAVIIRYVITTIGLCLACSLLGLTWSSVQWLVAAMTVGLGFGLQEIFANFVSGLIILFERPIRVGDLVTVSGVTGNVTETRIRATTITDFDRRELIVPNKKFITDDVINWTLSDNVSRVVIPVGIAYGSDTQLAHDLLLKVAREHTSVLSEPPPSAIFKGFGNSTLDYELRLFIPSRDVFPKVQHDMHMQIDRAFRDANIEIAFPQCDVHVHAAGAVASLAREKSAVPPSSDRSEQAA